jgi:phosphoribosylformimino-5-aminoimidazole carboxamide ribotide isomerase
VDLDGAFAGKPMNAAAVDAILSAVTVPVQLGGGIRDMGAIARWLERGVARVVLGTLALRAPEIVREACREFPGQIAIGIDAKSGRVAVEGWAESSEVSVLDLARKFEDSGAAAVIHTDIERDGTLAGLNVEATAELASALSIPVIASGGVASLADIKALRNAGAPIAGVIVGRALYDGRLDLGEALSVLEGAPC